MSRFATNRARADSVSGQALIALDRVLELVERRRLSTAELRILLRLVDRRAGLPELAEALGLPPVDVRCAARSLASRGLVRWLHEGDRKRTRLAITPDGLTTVRTISSAALLAPMSEPDGGDAAAERKESGSRRRIRNMPIAEHPEAPPGVAGAVAPGDDHPLDVRDRLAHVERGDVA
jgi:DNA-binding MarR family transcriptional regulator